MLKVEWDKLDYGRSVSYAIYTNIYNIIYISSLYSMSNKRSCIL